jgi:hypothetical protein
MISRTSLRPVAARHLHSRKTPMTPNLRTLAFAAGALLVGCGPTDVRLDPPKQGFQLKIDPYKVEKSSETQRCFFFEVPSDTPVFVNKFEIAQNEGTHHMNVFRTRTQKALWGAPGESVVEGECWKSINWSDWPLIVNSQESNISKPNPDDPAKNGTVVWQLPDGVAMRLEPHELIMLQSHYVNATTQSTPLQAKVFVNFNSIEESKVTAEVGTAFATNQSIKVCPGDVGKQFETNCRISDDKPVTIIGANSHFHSRGSLFTMSVFDPANTSGGDPFYSNTRWDDPPMRYDMNVTVPTGGGVHYTCEYNVPGDACGDPDNSCCFSFGGKVETQEHCNAFIYYDPKHRARGCF